MDEATKCLFDKADTARLSGDYAAAQPLLEQAIAGCPDEPECYWALGHVLLNTGDFDGAPVAFGKSVELDPENPRYVLDLARFHEMLGDFDAAKPLLERVVEMAPKSREAGEALKSLSYY